MNDTLQKVFKTGQDEESGGGAILGILILAVLIVGGMGLAKGCSKDKAKVSERAAVTEQAETSPSSADEAPSDAVVNAAARQAVLWKLTDPDSAKFRNVIVVAKPGQAKAVCGEVNAKNRMGGYAGYKRFISAGTAKLTYFEDDLADMNEAWRTLCVP